MKDGARGGASGDPAECLAGGGQMGALMRATDWAQTPLGPVASWPQSLRTSVSICLGTSFPMMIAWGPELCMLYNDGYLPVLGTRKHPRALGRPLLDCFVELRDLIGPMFRGVVATGEPVGATDMMFPIERHGYPEETYFVFSYSPIRDESGRVGGVLTTCTETTRRVIGERRLRVLRALAEASGHALTAEEALERAAHTLDPADTPFALLYLVEPDGERARLVATAGLPDRHGAALPAVALGAAGDGWPLAAALRAHAPQVVDRLGERFAPLPGGPWPEPAAQAVILPIARRGQPQPSGFLVAGVSPRRALDDDYRGYLDLVADHIATAVASARAREEERRRAEALAELDRAKTAFFSNVSHEFRTPLTLMLGPLEDLLAGRSGALAAAAREQVELTHRNALRLLKLVNTLLDFARIEAGRLRARYQPVDLAALTSQIAGSFRSAIERAGLTFEVACQATPEPVYVDVEMWEKVVLNLLSNALKFTFAGSIAVRLRPRGDCVELEVKDTGIGIAPEELPSLFERFHRIQGTRSRTHEGSGIGLALVQDLVGLHGGTISCESAPEHGSAFRATVRTGTAHLPADQIDRAAADGRASGQADAFLQEALRWLPGPAPAAAPPAPSSARVLVADDNADMRAYLESILGERWQVVAVANGADALAEATRTPPDLVLADVMMPVLDGFGLLRGLRADPRTAHVPVVMLSARAGEESRIEGLDAGADDYLVKPFAARELVARVASQLALARARQLLERQRTTLHSVFKQLPAAVAIVRGESLVYEMVNQLFLEIARRPEAEILGRPAFEVFPELRGQGFEELFRSVMRTGEPVVGREVPVRAGDDGAAGGAARVTYWNFVLAALPDEEAGDRVMSFSYEVTAQVRARRELEEALATRDDTVALLDATLDHAPVGLAFFDRDLRYRRINPALAEANGLPAEATLGRRVDEVLPGAIGAIARDAVSRAFATGAVVGPFEVTSPSPGDPATPRDWLRIYYPVRDRTGAVTHVGAAVVDVTVQKRAAREAELQRENLHNLFMQAPTPICILRGPDHVIELANTQCCAVWRRRPDEVVGRPLFRALPEIESAGFKELLDGVLASGETCVGKEVPAEVGPDGDRRTVYFNFVYAPLRTGEQVDGVLVLAFDVTDEVRAREQLSRTIRYNEMFAGTLAHDLRNPLSAIVSAAHVLLRRSDDPKITGPAGRIMSSSGRMARMIDQLLDFTRIRLGGGIGLEPKQVDLAEVTRRVVEEVESDQRRFDISVNGHALGTWDPDRLAQVISNLASNALQHGGPDGPFRIRLDGQRAEEVVVQFENTGAIPPELLPVLFDPFRGSENRRSNANGLGLGLFISREIITAHGGTIEVASSPEQGTRFKVVLPRAAGARAS